MKIILSFFLLALSAFAAIAQDLPPNTTRAIVDMTDRRWYDANGIPSQDFITADLAVDFNGSLCGSLTGSVTHAGTATKTQVQTAVRLKVNEWLDLCEPGASLNNSQIILGGLSD